MHRTALGLGLALLLAPAASPTEIGGLPAGDLFARDTYRIDTVVCPFKGEIPYQPGEIECGLLQVPENRDKPDSRFIELHFVKLSSTWSDEEEAEAAEDDRGPAPGRRDDPVIYLTGGPGARATYYVKRLKDHGILAHRDLYILEQRGIGFSGDFCPFYRTRKPEAGNAATFAEHLEANLADTADCAANALAAGVDLAGYNTLENARDVRALRIALGLERWNVWGISYGSLLGQAYLREDPEGVRAVVLDAIVPLDVRANPWAWQSVSWYVRDLAKLDELCRAQPDCARRYPDLGGRIREATLAVREHPIAVAVKDTESFPSGTAYLFPDVVAFLPFAFLYEQSNYPGLPAVIHAWADAVERRDEDLLRAVALAGGGFFESSQGMANAVLCNDGHVEVQVAAGRADLEAHPVLGSAVGSVEVLERQAEICLELGMAPRPSTDYAPVETDIPALLIAGDMDPITPPPLAQAVLPGFTNGTYVEFPWAGHGASRSVECAGEMLNLFFDDPTVEPDLGCVEEVEPPDFHAPLYTTSFAPRVMVRALEDRKSLALPGLWGGGSALASLAGFLGLSLAPLARRVDRREAVRAPWARASTWLAAALATVAVAVLAAAGVATFKEFEALLLFGMVSWARFGAFAGLLAGVAAVAAVILTLRAHRRSRLPVTALIGFLLTAAAALSVSLFLAVWDLGVF